MLDSKPVEALQVQLEAQGHRDAGPVEFALSVFDLGGGCIFGFASERAARFSIRIEPGEARGVLCELPSLNLMPGTYFLTAAVISSQGRTLLDAAQEIFRFEVVERDVYGTGIPPKGPAVVFVDSNWRLVH